MYLPVQIFFQQSGHNGVDLLSYYSKPTDQREQYDCRANKKLDGYVILKLGDLYFCNHSLNKYIDQ